MRHVRLIGSFALALVAAAWFAMPQLAARQTPPGAPSNLTYLVNGPNVSLQWTHAAGPFTHYRVEAGGVPGGTFFVFDTTAFSNPDPFSKLQQLLSGFSAGPVGSGTYFVRTRGMNGAIAGPVSNEIALPVTGGCQAPGAPTNFGAIVRGTSGFLQWNPGSGGVPTTYILYAAFAPNDPNPPFQIPLATPYFTLGIPGGSYYVRIAAANACGQSARSNEVLIASPSNTPARTPDPAPGQRLPMPYVHDLVFQFAQRARNLGYLNPQVACPTRPAGTYNPTYELEARKTQRNAYIDYIVSNLRTIDTRFGFNAKPTRTVVPSIIAGDEIAYHYGSDAPEGSPNVYLMDVLGGHCTGVSGDPDRHAPDYRVFFDEFGRWTLAGLTP